MKLEPLKKKQDRQVQSGGFSVSGSPDHVLSYVFLNWSGMKPREASPLWTLASCTSLLYTGWSFTRLNAVSCFEAQELSASAGARVPRCTTIRQAASPHVIWNTALPKALGHFNDCTWTCWTAGMCIQIKAIETQVPGPRNSETKTWASEQCSQVLCLAEGGSTQAPGEAWQYQPPLQCDSRREGASHSSVLSKGRTLLNMHRRWISSVHNSLVSDMTSETPRGLIINNIDKSPRMTTAYHPEQISF